THGVIGLRSHKCMLVRQQRTRGLQFLIQRAVKEHGNLNGFCAADLSRVSLVPIQIEKHEQICGLPGLGVQFYGEFNSAVFVMEFQKLAAILLIWVEAETSDVVVWV